VASRIVGKANLDPTATTILYVETKLVVARIALQQCIYFAQQPDDAFDILAARDRHPQMNTPI
jgi:hypothetical protein